MAKKSLAERLKAIDGLSNDINKDAGKVIVGRISTNNDIKEKLKHKFIPGPSLNVNEAFGGGLPIGNTTIICGLEDSGKTMYLLETIAMNQKADPEFIALWLESEHSIKQATLDMFGIDRERFIYLEHERTGAGEQAVNRLESFVASGTCNMAVINSLKCLVPSEEFQKDMASSQVGLQSRMNNKLMRKLTSVVEENQVALAIVQHLTTQIGGSPHQDPMILAGGLGIRYGAILIADYRKRSIGKDDPVDRESAIKISVSIKKNHVVTDRYPYIKTSYYAVYGEGVEVYLEVLDLALEQGVLVKNGAFIKLPDEDGNPVIENGVKMQWQGNAKFRQYCIENNEFFERLKSCVNGKTELMSLSEIIEAKKEEKLEMELVENSDDIEKIEELLNPPEPKKKRRKASRK